MSAGLINQGSNTIAIGAFAGYSNQISNSIILNALGVSLNATTVSGFYVAPVARSASNNNDRIMTYNPTTFQVQQNANFTISGDRLGVGLTNPADYMHNIGAYVSGPASNTNKRAYFFYDNTDNNATFGAVNIGVADLPFIFGRYGSSSLIVGGATSSAYKLRVVGDAAKTVSSVWAAESDIRIKKNIVDASLDICYDNIKNMRLRYFEWDENYIDDVATTDRHVLGFVAQEVHDKFPKAVKIENSHEFVLHKRDASGNILRDDEFKYVQEKKYLDNFMSLDIDQIIKTHVGETQKLIQENEDLNSRVSVLENIVQQLLNR